MRMKGRKKTQTPNDGVGDSSGLFSRVSRLMTQCSSMDWFHAESLGFKSVQHVPMCHHVSSCAIMYPCWIVISHHSWNSLRTARDARQWVWPMLKHSNGSWKWKPLQWARHRGGWAGGPLKKNKKISRYVYWNYFLGSCICKSIYADTPHWPEVCILAWEGSVKQYVYIVQSNIQGFWRDKFVICGPEMINFCVITLGLGQKYQASSCQKMA